MSWLSGDLTTPGRIWSALAPLLMIGSYFFLGLSVYLIRRPLKGRYRDAELEARGTSVLLGAETRAFFAWLVRPIWELLRVMRVPPDAITTLSVLLAAAAGVSVAFGRFTLGGWLYLFAGVCDFLDGRIARTTGRATPAGAALDSILDRYAESVVMIGLAWYYRGSWVLAVVLASMLGSLMVSYIRARGEGLGVDVKVGIMQRPERLVLLGGSMAFAPVLEALLVPTDPHPMHRLTVWALVFLAVAANATAAVRLVHVLRALTPVEQQHPEAFSFKQGGLGRNVIAAFVATVLDFIAVNIFVGALGLSPSLATGLGCVVGGVVNFTINRFWVFKSQGAPLGEGSRYFLVSASSALLNAGGVAVALFIPGLNYRIAWALVRGIVFLGWNFPLQRDYVFNHGTPAAEPTPVESAS